MEYLNVYTISIALVVLLLLVLIIVISNAFRNSKPINYGPSEVKTDDSNEFELVDVVKCRFREGIEESVSLVKTIERKLIIELGNMEEDSEEEDDGRAREIDEKLEALGQYIQSCVNTISTPNLAKEFIKNMHVFIGENQSADLRLYHYLLNLLTIVDNEDELPEIIDFIIKTPSFRVTKNHGNEQFKVLFEEINHFKEEVEASQIHIVHRDGREVQTGVEKLKRTIVNVNRSLDKVEKPHISEITCFKTILEPGFLHKIKEFELKRIERPVFDIQLLQKGPIKISESKVLLNFRITNRKHGSFKIDYVEVLPIVDSNDFRYEGVEKTRVKLSSGKNTQEFHFHTYYYDEIEYDKNPIIEFKVFYRINKRLYKLSYDLVLPEVIPTLRIHNPFEEGESGIELPGNSGLFFGRTDILGTIAENFLNRIERPSFFLIIGAPRSGKSSILNQLANNPKWLGDDRFIPLKISTDLSGPEDFFRDLFDEMYGILESEFKVGISKDDLKQLKESRDLKVNTIKVLLGILEEDIKKTKKKLLILIDEYQGLAYRDKLEEIEEIAMVQSQLHYQLPAFVKSIRDNFSNIANIVLTGYEDFEKTARFNVHWIEQLGGRVSHLKVENFSKTDTENFARINFEKHSFILNEKAQESLWLYTAGHAFLLVKICFALFESLIKNHKKRDDKEIDENDINKAVESLTFSDLKFIWFEKWLLKDITAKMILSYLGDTAYDDCFKHGIDLSKVHDFEVRQLKADLKKYYNIIINDDSMDAASQELSNYGIIHLTKQSQSTRIQLRYPLFAKFCRREDLFDKTLKEYEDKYPRA